MSLQCEKKIKCTCLRTLKASIGTITIFTRSCDSSSARCTGSTAGQMMPAVLAGDSSQVLLLCQLTGYRLTGC